MLDTVVDITRANGFINPTHQEYYTFTRPYGVRKTKILSFYQTILQ